MTDRTTRLTLLLALALVVPAQADAQVRRGRAASGNATNAAWAPISIGPRLGYDQRSFSGGEIIGVVAHFPLLRSGRLELMPSAELTFLSGAKERQYAAELVYVTGGAQGGVYGGFGVGIRNSVLDPVPPDTHRNVTTYSAVAGARSGLGGRVQTAIEFRWIFVPDTELDPTPLTLAFSFPLWRNTPS